MATYKVIQDIEAEDKLLGPLSLRQFIYAIIVVVLLFIAWQLIMVQWLLAIPLLIPIAFFGLLAAPIGVNQSSEIWLLAKIRFFLKPRRRIWDQSGIKQLVTITAPKRIEHALTNNLSETEVRSRLQALANTIDSRGWAIKNVNVNLFAQPAYANAQTSDRLIDPSAIPQEVTNNDITAADDIMDERNNPTAAHLDQMITASSQAHRQQLVSQMQQGGSTSQGTQPDYWFLNQNSGQTATAPAGYATFDHNSMVAPGSSQSGSKSATPDEQALLDKLHRDEENTTAAYGHMRTIDPLDKSGKSKKKASSKSHAAPEAAAKPQETSRPPASPAILELASNDDLNVATIARQANKKSGQGPADGEVVISLR